MASIRKKDRSPFWFACFTLPDGAPTQRSTGTSERKIAQRIANEYEDAARDASAGRFIESRARKAIADIYAMALPERLASSSLCDFMDAWLKRKEIEARETTHEKYTSVVCQFKAHLGRKAQHDITNITGADITQFRDTLARRVTPGTVNVALKIIRSAFAQARRDGLIDLNEADRVTLLKHGQDRVERRAFTLEELKRILEVVNDEWRGMVLFGLYTGQRLGDIASLKWNNIDLQRAELRLLTGKTGRRQILPLAKPLLSYVETIPAGDATDTPLFPRIYEMTKQAGKLSNQFHDILVSAGLAIKTTHKATGKGHSGKRLQNAVSFHSLRHTATSLLKSAGLGNGVCRP
jgi:integrase